MDDLEQNYARNKSYAKQGEYQTQLDPMSEALFQSWLIKNKVPFDPAEKLQDYDMRGFYKGLLSGDPRAKNSIDPFDKQMHFPDVWKTPYHETFSNESMYSTPNAPRWTKDGRYLKDAAGAILFDAKKK